MATLDIFNNDAFSVSALTQTIVDIPRVPTQLGDEGLFTEYGIRTTTMMIERTGSSLSLVPTAPRGGTGQTVNRQKRKMIPIAAVHIPQRDTIMADEVLNVRAFGSETELKGVQDLVREQQVKMKGNLDLTLEYHRIGAIRGLVLDADGIDVLYDLYSMFGMTQEQISFDIANSASSSDLKQKCVDLKRAIRNSLGGRSFSGVMVRCSEAWFDKFVAHNSMKKAWDLWQSGQFYRESQAERDFSFAGVDFRIYSGGTSEGDFIPAGEAYAHPTGVPRMFQTAYAPGDYMSTVGTTGVPYYSSQERMPHDKGVELESQSNPITLNTLPESVKKLVL